MSTRWLRYAAIELIGVVALALIAMLFNTATAGWFCGSGSMLWLEIVKFVKQVRE